METHSSILAWRIPWQRSLVGYSAWSRVESVTIEKLTEQQQQKGLQEGSRLSGSLGDTHTVPDTGTHSHGSALRHEP